MVYPFQTHLINCFVFIDCENGDIANTEKISNFLTKNKSKYLKEETKILCFFGKNKTLDSWKSGVSEKISDLSNFEFIATNENADMIISAFFGVLYRDYPKAEFIIISHDHDYSSLVNYFSGLKICMSQQKICEQKSKKQNTKSRKQNKNPPAKKAASTIKQTVAKNKETKTEQKKSNGNTKTTTQKTEKKKCTIDDAIKDILTKKREKRCKTKASLKNQINQKYFLSDGNADDLIKKLESDGVIEIKNNKITWKK